MRRGVRNRRSGTPRSPLRENRKNCRFAAIHRAYFARSGVDNPAPQRLYRRFWRAAAWRDGASAKPLTVYTVTEHPAMLFVAMFASPRRMRGLLSAPA